MKLMTMKKRELLDLCIVLIVAAILSIFSISIHTIGKLFSFFNAYTDLPLAEFLINVSFLSLMGLLWITYIRWKKAAKRQAELENIISSISPDVLLVVDSDRTIIECNNSVKRMFGYEVDQVINQKIDLLYFDRRSNPEPRQEIFDILERESFLIGLATGKKKNGETIPLEIIAGNLGHTNGAVLLLRDITERKRAEKELRESEERYGSLFHHSNDAIFMHDLGGNVIDVNEKALSQFGYTKREISSLKISDLHPPEALRKSTWAFEKISKDGFVSFEIDFKKKNGRVFPAEVSSSLFEVGGKKVIQGIVRDITERKRMEEKLQKSEKKYRTLVEAAQEGIGITDPDENITFANKAFADLLGYSKEELLGLNLSQISDEEQFARFREETKKRRQGKRSRYDIRVYTKTGEPKHFSLSATPLFDEEARFYGCLGMFIDITERKRAEEKLKDYTHQIEEKNLELKAKNLELTATRAQLVQKEKLRALGQMASGVAHNFNNLLAIILGRAQLLQRKAKELETERGLRSIERAALDASSTVKRIQDFTRVRKDQEFKWVDLDEVIEDVTALTKTKWKDQAEANGIGIRLEVQKDRRRLPSVAGDESELKEAFTSIVFNAVDAMPKGGKIVIRTRTNRKSVFVYFIDSGIGISEEAKQKIFDPFFTTKGVRNAGLGLSVAYGIIQRHQGDIQIESKQGEGTTVVVRLPVSKTLGKEEPKEKESEKPSMQGESANILVIEDEKDVRELLFDILTSTNYMVKLASSGAEGLEICKREKFDIVFTDLGMPRMSGWEVAQAIKEINSNATVFLITGWGVEMEEEKLKESGIDRVVTKPVKVEALLTLVSDAMESKKRGKEPVEGSLVHPVEGKEAKN